MILEIAGLVLSVLNENYKPTQEPVLLTEFL
jgi:hypothetical protein